MPDDRANGGIKVMEHREPPRIGPGDRPIDGATTQPVGGAFRLRRFDQAGKSRKVDYPRIGLLICAGLALSAGLFWARRVSLDWLANQPQYQIPFDQIQLIDAAGQPSEPPQWYRGGAHAFLENVRIDSREPEAISVLQLPKDRLSQIFKNYAWVEDLIRVEYPPGSIRVQLRYRQPVAWVQLRGGDQIMVDDEGTILPAKDIDVAALGRVIKIFGDVKDGGLAPPSDHRFGVKWKSREHGGELDKVDERILGAARLASFLVHGERARDAERLAALRMVWINVTLFSRGGLFVTNAEDTMIFWGDAPKAERPESVSADEKWTLLRRWAETTEARFLVAPDYWALSKDDVHFVCLHPGARHRPSLTSDRGVGKPDAP
jgi:hypothetical protein